MRPFTAELALVEVSDLVRVNQLVRSATDTEGLGRWYRSLSAPEQTALTVTLIELAKQAGSEEGDWRQAIGAAGLVGNRELVERLRAYVEGTYFPGDNSIHYRWLHGASDADRVAAFWLAAHLFGIAGRRELDSCGCGGRHHWWHRDLMDDRVVQEILANPKITA